MVCFHAGVPWLRGAFVAVDVFFVLAGFFLMTALTRRIVADEDVSLGDALLGDSHAEHWLEGLDRAGKEHGWRVESHVMGGCPVSNFSGLTKGSTSRRYRECNRYREAALNALVAQKPRDVILSSFDSYIRTGSRQESEYQVSEAVWTEGLRRTYSRLDRVGIQVIVIRGTPRIPFDVPTCLSRRAARLLLARECTYSETCDSSI